MRKLLIAALLAAVAATAFAHEREGLEFMIQSGDSTWMNRGRGFDRLELKAKYGSHFAAFIVDGRQYVITDPNIVGQIEGLYEPMMTLGKEQAALAKKQAALAKEQAQLAGEQGRLGGEQGRLGAEQARLGVEDAALAMSGRRTASADRLSRQRAIDEQQRGLGEKQRSLGEKQRGLGERQSALGDEQEQLGRKQEALATESASKIEQIFEKALKSGAAIQVK